jgi:predicted NUDIX family NTP pyrophosphohydrolase
MSKKRDSAGLVLYRHRRGSGTVEFFLVHPGGPYWANKDLGAWSIPKGEIEPGEDRLDAARRETLEETGFAPSGRFEPLPPVRLPGGKTVHAFAIEADVEASALRSGTFELEWPPRSGRTALFPEVDRGQWFAWGEALEKISKGQRPILEQLLAKLGVDVAAPPS